MSYKFLKNYRLLNKSDFQNLRSGSRFFAFGVLIFYVKPNELNHSRLGIAVSKKFGKANMRNKFKRIVRESFRQTNIEQQGLDILVAPNFRNIKANSLESTEIFRSIKKDFVISFNCKFNR